MKPKLFSGESLLVSLKGLGSYIVTAIASLPLWFLALFFLRKGYVVISSIFGVLFFAWYLFFWGYISKVFWKWS